jgi:hypothetical protein
MAGAHADQDRDRSGEAGKEEQQPQQTQPAEEWGERQSTARAIERGGKGPGAEKEEP